MSVLIDAVFLAGWVMTNWLADTYIFPNFRLNGLHANFAHIMEVVFAVSTLIPVVIYVIVDLTTIVIRARRTILEEVHGEVENEQV